LSNQLESDELQSGPAVVLQPVVDIQIEQLGGQQRAACSVQRWTRSTSPRMVDMRAASGISFSKVTLLVRTAMPTEAFKTPVTTRAPRAGDVDAVVCYFVGYHA
tara:strand:- start:1826 stop:2137 length:312 start_codon:yes stop_codon:yes gene_type:complete